MIALLLGLGLGLLGGLLWRSSSLQRREQEWKTASDAELRLQRGVFADSMNGLRRVSAERQLIIDQLLAEEREAVRRERLYADSVRIYRTRIAASTTLTECQESAERMATACETALQQADSARALQTTRADVAEGMIVVERQRTELALERLAAANRLLVKAPVGEKKWLGFLSRPRAVIGIGCAGGIVGSGCGLAVTVGFPISF